MLFKIHQYKKTSELLYISISFLYEVWEIQ